MSAWKASGQSAARFARESGINPGTLTWWSWRLGGAGKSVSRRPRKAAVVSPLTFVEMTTVAAGHESLEVVLSSSVRIRVPRGFDESTLQRLLDVLGRSR